MKTTIRTRWKQLLLLALGGLCMGSLRAQVTFQREYDIPDNTSYFNQQKVKCVAQSPDDPNAYYFAGGFESNKPSGYPSITPDAIFKTNHRGETQWMVANVYWGGVEDIKCIMDDNNNMTGLVTVGAYKTGNGYYGYQIGHIDPTGVQVSNYFLVGGSRAHHVEQTKGATNLYNGFVVVGEGQDNIIMLKLDNNFNFVWSKEFDFNGRIDEAYCVKQCSSDKGYIITGRSNDDLVIIRTNSAGTILWTKFVRTATSMNANSIRGNFIQEDYNGGNPFYYILATNTNDNGSSTDDNLAVIKILDNGTITMAREISTTADDVAFGLLRPDASNLVISASVNNQPALLKVNAAVSSSTFAWKYTNSNGSVDVIPTLDNGYMLGGYKGDNFYAIKTDGNGESDCFEETVSFSYQDLTYTTPTRTVTEPSTIIYSGTSNIYEFFNMDEESYCQDLCSRIVPGNTPIVSHVCYGGDLDMQALCPPGTVTTDWYALPDLVNVVGTGSNLHIAFFANASYKVVCKNEDGCVIGTTTYSVEVSAQTSFSDETIEACQGKYLTLTAPSCPGGTISWIHPASGLNSPSVNVEALTQGETFEVACLDAFGCPISIKTFTIDITTYPYVQTLSHTICMGGSVDLNTLVASGITCSWSTLPDFTPIFGSTVSPGTTTSYYAECRDANGCFVLYAIEIVVSPPTIISLQANLCEGEAFNFNQMGGPNCHWTYRSSGLPFPGGSAVVLPIGTHEFRLVCVDGNGCISYIDLDINVSAPTMDRKLITVPCPYNVDLNSYPSLCGPISSWYQWAGSVKVPVSSPFLATGPTTVYGVGNCCIFELEIRCGDIIEFWGGEDASGIEGAPVSDRNISLYPNPSSGIFNLNIQEIQALNYNVQVTDMLGKTVWSANEVNSGKELSIDLSSMSKGIYQVNILFKDQVITRKIVLQ